MYSPAFVLNRLYVDLISDLAVWFLDLPMREHKWRIFSIFLFETKDWY